MRTLSERVAIALGWSEPGSERSKLLAAMDNKSASAKILAHRWYPPIAYGWFSYQQQPIQYESDIAGCFKDIIPMFGWWKAECRKPGEIHFEGRSPDTILKGEGIGVTLSEAMCRAFLAMKELDTE